MSNSPFCLTRHSNDLSCNRPSPITHHSSLTTISLTWPLERVLKVQTGLDNGRNRLFVSCLTVLVDGIPAFASILRDRWIPAFAGMTVPTYVEVAKRLMVMSHLPDSSPITHHSKLCENLNGKLLKHTLIPCWHP